jgi:hypothetical protein
VRKKTVTEPNAPPAAASELERIARLYIDGLLSADDSKVPLSKNVRRAHLIVHCGGPHVWQIAQGAETVRRNIRAERLTQCRNLRVTVDRENSTVVALWESAMDADGARAITIVDRFVISDGLISELEIISIPQNQPFAQVPYSG